MPTPQLGLQLLVLIPTKSNILWIVPDLNLCYLDCAKVIIEFGHDFSDDTAISTFAPQSFGAHFSSVCLITITARSNLTHCANVVMYHCSHGLVNKNKPYYKTLFY